MAAMLAVLLCVPAAAQDNSGFSHYEKSVIREYFRQKADNLMPGEWEKNKEEDSARDEDWKEAGEDRGEENAKGRGKGRGRGQFGKGKSDQLPPGLAKRDELPPGLQRQLRERGTLPPGLAKRDLPEDLDARLPVPEQNEQRVIVDDDVVLIDKTTQTIIDIIEDVATGGKSD
jgi:Ni/Co efflux regulator RcnB